VVVSGLVQVTTVDENQQEVTVARPAAGEFFGFASMLDQTPHQTSAIALEETVCL
jgi:CRP/FNR family transcriptional regulator, cyclic AMP receptor protein